jgi:hypothetical protein
MMPFLSVGAVAERKLYALAAPGASGMNRAG